MKVPSVINPIQSVPPDMIIPVLPGKSKLWLKPTDQIDTWLDAQGFYRKHIARDASSLFRCVSEQVFLTQVHHLTVRKHCIQFAMNQPEVFRKMTNMPVKEYVDRLYNQREWGHTLDMEIMSQMYCLDFKMFKEIKKPSEQITSNGNHSFITLSLSYDHHYDSVYPKKHIMNAAICQSILYEMLYKYVFKLEEVDYAVNKMLHDKTARYQTELNAAIFATGFQMRLEMRDSYKNVKELLNCGITPFPYKVAKSLDPNIYRNVEYDTWNEQRKGIRHSLMTWNNRELQIGTKCVVNFKEEHELVKRHGYIQQMSPNKGPVVVFIEELGEKLTVPFESLELLPSSDTGASQSENIIETLSNMTLKISSPEKTDCMESKSNYSIAENNEHTRKLENSYHSTSVSSNIVTDLCNVQYVHTSSPTVPTTCYACITSHEYLSENEIKPSIHSRMNSGEEYSKLSHNVSSNDINSPEQPLSVAVQYPMPIYPVISSDVDIPPSVYSNNILPPKISCGSNEPNDLGTPLRVIYNNSNVDVNSCYRYGIPTMPYYVVTPNYILPITAEPPTPSNSDIQRLQYSPTSMNHHPNDLVYAVPVNSLPNPKTDVPMYSPLLTFSPMPSMKKPLQRNSGMGDVMTSPDSYHVHKDVMYVKEPTNANINIQPSNPVPTNIYPYYNNPYMPPMYYHNYDVGGSCYPSCPEMSSYQENVTNQAYQIPHLVPMAYPEDMYPQNSQIICQPMLPASHN